MKKLLALFLLVCTTCSAQPVYFAPMVYGDDYSKISNQFATVMTPYPDVSTYVTALSVVPPNLKSVDYSFAIGTCGSELWSNSGSGISASAMIAANLPQTIAAGKSYMISTGGANYQFQCGSNTAMYNFIHSYCQPSTIDYCLTGQMVGVKFDIEGGATGGNVAMTIIGNTLTCTNNGGGNCNNITISAGCLPLVNGVALGTEIVSGSGTSWTVNTSGNNFTGTAFVSCPTAYTQAQVTSLVAGASYVQHNYYPNLKISISVGGYGGTNPYYAMGPYGIYAYNAMQTYPLTNYRFDIQQFNYTLDSQHCILRSDNLACEVAQTAIQNANWLQSYWGIPYANQEWEFDNGVDGTNSFEAMTPSDIANISAWATANGFGGIYTWNLNRDRDCSSAITPGDNCNYYLYYASMGNMGLTKLWLFKLGY